MHATKQKKAADTQTKSRHLTKGGHRAPKRHGLGVQTADCGGDKIMHELHRLHTKAAVKREVLRPSRQVGYAVSPLLCTGSH